MLATEQVARLLDGTYYAGINRGDAVLATSALALDVEWSHSQVWPHSGMDRSPDRTALRGRSEVAAFLGGRLDTILTDGVVHRLGAFVFDGAIGSARSYVRDGAGRSLPFSLWFEIRDDLVSRYAVYPLENTYLGDEHPWLQT